MIVQYLFKKQDNDHVVREAVWYTK